MPTVKKNADVAVRLSQCMIVKNEGKNIERALSWAKDVVFEQIVVDTGSTDRTVEIAGRMGAKVFHFEWKDDFAAAKNYALDQASGDWIVFLDADEYMSPEHARLIIPLIENITKLYGGRAVSLVSKLAQARDDGSISQIDHQQRIFINRPDVRYERPIHESLKLPAGTFPVRENDIVIIHAGYSQGVYADTGKLKRNIVMLKKALEADPEDVKSKFYLAEAFHASGNTGEAIPLYREALIKTSREKSAYEWFRMRAFYRLTAILINDTKTYGEAYALAEQAFQEFPEHINFCCLYGISVYNQGKYKNALDVFKKAENLIINGKIENQLFGNIDSLYIYLVQTYIKLDDPDEAQRYAASYLKSHKQNDEMLKLYIQLLRSRRNPENALNILSEIYNLKNIQDKMLLLRNAKDAGDIALAQLLIKMINPEMDTLRLDHSGARRLIPKKIHYCWLSGEQMPDMVLECINSWKKIMPEYELVLWDNNRFNVESTVFTKEACSVKKWAFAADYIRLYALYTEGGIYLDTDVFVKKKFDVFLRNGFFSSFEYWPQADKKLLNDDGTLKNQADGLLLRSTGIQAAVMGGEKGHPFLKSCLDWYKDKHFILPDGKFHDEAIAPIIYADVMRKYGFRYKNERQKLQDGIMIYPSYVFAACLLHAQKESYAIHICAGGWHSAVSAPFQAVFHGAKCSFDTLCDFIEQHDANAIFRKVLEKCAAGADPELIASMPIGGYSRAVNAGGSFSRSNAYYADALKDITSHFGEFKFFYSRLSDYISREVFTYLLRYRVFPMQEFIRAAYALSSTYPQYFDEDIFNFGKDEVFVDCGGYAGNTAAEFINRRPDYKRVYIYEPLAENIEKCRGNLTGRKNIVLRQAGAGKEYAQAAFYREGDSSGSFLPFKNQNGDTYKDNICEIVALDEDIKERVTFIKIDAEGLESDAVRGASEHIKNDSPRLAICLHNMISDIWEIPKLIDKVNPNYKYHLRHYNYDQNRDYVLYAIPAHTS